jgi:hypothetical protein
VPGARTGIGFGTETVKVWITGSAKAGVAKTSPSKSASEEAVRAMSVPEVR